MAEAERKRRKRRLERAGFVYVAGWLPDNDFSRRAAIQIEMWQPDVEKIANTEPPKGRPPKP